MEWGEDYQHGIIWQDFQHKQLVDNINRLLDSIVTGSNDKDTFYKAIRFIKEYSRSHFQIEELYMRKYRFLEKKKHVEEHHRFINTFNKFISECIYHENESSAELLNKLNTWFFHHTQTTDKVLADFLLKHGVI